MFETNDAGSQPAERMRLDSDGKLGINTTNTGGGYLGLAVDSSNTNALATGGIALNLKNKNTTDNSWVSMDFNNSVGGIVGRIGAQFVDTSDKDTDLYFATRADGGNLTERLRIGSDGTVRVGADDFDGTGDSDTSTYKIAGTTNEVYTLALTEKGGQCLALATRLDGAGSSTNSVRFFDGPGIASVATINVSASTVTYGTGSDYRMKENQVNISDGITRVKQLKPYRFNWKSEYGGGDKVDGFFAHETSTVVPEAVQGTKDAVDSDGNIIRQQIDQAKLVPVLTAALKEAITKIETLETKVAALESS
jgi:hypothetical protein